MLTVNGLYLCSSSSGQGYLDVGGVGSTLMQNGASTLTIGGTTNSYGRVVIFDQAVFTSGTGAITVNPTGYIYVNDATFNANGNLTVANAGAGVVLENQGQINSRDVFVGTNEANGAVLINGYLPGFGQRATWGVTGNVTVGGLVVAPT